VKAALQFAAAAAALKCTRHGGGLAAPQRIEVEEFLSMSRATALDRTPRL
jgi:sugar/nucleoside kinase (ribokinase family)